MKAWSLVNRRGRIIKITVFAEDENLEVVAFATKKDLLWAIDDTVWPKNQIKRVEIKVID